MGFWSQGQAKTPTQTWKAYGDDFLQHHSSRVPASFLAAVAQLESSGNPWATPPWVWRWSELGQSWFGIYAPMSSAAGLYQFLDETFARVERREGRFLASRILATDAIELASRDFHWALDQMFSGNHRRFVNARHFVERFKALHHLCGFGVARAWAEPRLRQISQLGLQRLQRMENVDFGNEPRRCGSHDTELYFSKLLHFRKQFDAIIDNGRPRLLAPDVSQRTDPLSSRPDAQASGVR